MTTLSKLNIDDEAGTDIREMYRKQFPTWSQPFFSWLTGKPFNGQQPLFLMRAETHILLNVLQLSLGIALLLIGIGG